ncbi:serine/threonine-protein kinase [Schaalia sp. 19OD2882]|uniref:serine/threonine-protein kinase n=1 Tax=Schaalia sp. 19OD2882 TaxID=2794089 RepID=UPI0020A81847|nr:serine/threonine-protein kinase [Schaalia sp. 19OD2882]
MGGYRLVHRLGAGGAGTVWLAEDEGGGQVALKLIHPALASSDEARERLVREARIVNSVSGEGVAHVLDIEVEGAQPFVVTELVEGPSLASLLDTGPLHPYDLAALARLLHSTLDKVHAARIVHRDVKPSNVICSPQGPVLIDFGIALAEGDQRLTSTGLISGTAGFTAPELLTGELASPDTDWWALSATLLNAATGRQPYGSGASGHVLMRVMEGRCDTDGLSEALTRVLLQALEPAPETRPRPQHFVELFEAACGVEPGCARWRGVPSPLNAEEAARVHAGLVPRPIAGAPWTRPAPPPAPDRPIALGLQGFPDDSATTLMPAPTVGATTALPEGHTLPPPPVPMDFRPTPIGPGGLRAPFAPRTAPAAPVPVAQHPPPPPARQVVGPSPAPITVQPAPILPVVNVMNGLPLYIPRSPRPAWFTGLFMLMPLAMIAAVGGAYGSCAVLAVLLVTGLPGALHRAREQRRVRHSGPKASDTWAVLAASPWHLVVHALSLLFGLLVGAATALSLWAVAANVIVGAPSWYWPFEVVTATGSVEGSHHWLHDPLWFGLLLADLWVTLAIMWMLPTGADLRRGVALAAEALLPQWWARGGMILIALAVVGSTWMIATLAMS